MSQGPEIRTLSLQLDRARATQLEQRRARRRHWFDRLEPVLAAVCLAVLVGVLGPSLDDEASTNIAMSMMPR